MFQSGKILLAGNTKTFTYYPGQVGLPNEASPRVLNKSWTITDDVEVPDRGEGMIVLPFAFTGKIDKVTIDLK